MPKFTDALRGYGFETMKRDGFKCRYCGLDGSESFSNWLALSEDHLLPKGHPDRNNRDFIVSACHFCNMADNRYFDLAASRGMVFDGLSAEELVDLRRAFVERTRAAYREFWKSSVVNAVHILPNEVKAEPLDLEGQKARFISEVAKVRNHDEAAANAIVAALQHNKTYISGDIDGRKFRAAFAEQLMNQDDRYLNAVEDDEYCAVILEIGKALTVEFERILSGGHVRIGTVQKALNLYLKTLWCMEPGFPTPPHCPVDRSVLEKVGISESWTKLDSIKTYCEWIEELRRHSLAAGFENLSEWELQIWPG